MIYCIIFCMFFFSILILLIYVLCTGKLAKRRSAEDTTQVYDDTVNFEGIMCMILIASLITKCFYSSS